MPGSMRCAGSSSLPSSSMKNRGQWCSAALSSSHSPLWHTSPSQEGSHPSPLSVLDPHHWPVVWSLAVSPTRVDTAHSAFERHGVPSGTGGGSDSSRKQLEPLDPCSHPSRHDDDDCAGRPRAPARPGPQHRLRIPVLVSETIAHAPGSSFSRTIARDSALFAACVRHLVRAAAVVWAVHAYRLLDGGPSHKQLFCLTAEFELDSRSSHLAIFELWPEAPRRDSAVSGSAELQTERSAPR